MVGAKCTYYTMYQLAQRAYVSYFHRRVSGKEFCIVQNIVVDCTSSCFKAFLFFKYLYVEICERIRYAVKIEQLFLITLHIGKPCFTSVFVTFILLI